MKNVINMLGTFIKGAFIVGILTFILTVAASVVAVGYLATTNPGPKKVEAHVREQLDWKTKMGLAFTSDHIKSKDFGLYSCAYWVKDGHEVPVAYGIAGKIHDVK